MSLDDSPGILPSQWIRGALDAGILCTAEPVKPTQIQPNSLDLRLGTRGWRVGHSLLPGRETVCDKLERYKWFDAPLDEGGRVLEPNQVYVFQLAEALNLPPSVAATFNPKSSTGRLDVFSRVVGDYGEQFDSVPEGYTGPLFVEIVPRSFGIRVRPGDSLVQARFVRGDPQLEAHEVADLIENHSVVMRPESSPQSCGISSERGLLLSVRVRGESNETIGFRPRKNQPPIDLQAVGKLPLSMYWERIVYRPDEPLILTPDEFYILASSETICLPPSVCAEMVPFEAPRGEVRTHYAGFFDSGFGYHPQLPATQTGSAVVLEVRTRDVPFMLDDAQFLFRILLLRNSEPPDILYGTQLDSNYQGQRLRLGKQFCADPDNWASPGGTNGETNYRVPGGDYARPHRNDPPSGDIGNSDIPRVT